LPTAPRATVTAIDLANEMQSDFKWTTGSDASISHVVFIDAGAFGTVHKVTVCLFSGLTRAS